MEFCCGDHCPEPGAPSRAGLISKKAYETDFLPAIAPDEGGTVPENFLDVLRRRGVDGPLPPPDRGGPAGQAVRPGAERRAWDFAFATGIECSNPRIINHDGRPLRRDLLEECGHYRHLRRVSSW